jgi:EAL domain-containing protein (putative c-di-GMP-specific phosphodiesterase class I)/CheY-like chemotaxis protein
MTQASGVKSRTPHRAGGSTSACGSGRTAGVRGVSRPRLVAIDDDSAILDVVGAIGRRCGYDVVLISDPSGLSSALAQSPAAVIVTDLSMPNVDGVTVLRNLAKAHSGARIIIVSAADSKTLTAAVRVGVNYGLEMAPPLSKPFEVSALEAALAQSPDITSAKLLQAMAGGELEVRYQPKVSLRPEDCGRVIGAEALVRWNHPERGLLAADRFIEIAEKEGLVEPLSAWVISEVIHDLGRWSGVSDEFAVAVNLPACFLEDIDFPDQVAAMLKHGGAAPDRLTIEVTEREAIRDQTKTIDVMTRLRLLGVGLSMDDFGIGHSSLAELYRMPFSEVKIDASFVRDLGAFPDAGKVVGSIIELARQLEIDCCAEGIETAAQSRDLQEAGCTIGQGYLYGGAFAAAHFEGVLNAGARGDPGVPQGAHSALGVHGKE